MCMEQITLVFLIGAFILFLIQFRFTKIFPIRIMGLFTGMSVVALTLSDNELATFPEGVTIMVIAGFIFTLYALVGMLKEV